MPGKRNTTVRVTQIKSGIGYNKRIKRTLKALGLGKMHRTVEHAEGPAMRGMIEKVSFLVRVEENGT